MGKWYQFPCGCKWPLLEENPPEGAIPFIDLDSELAPDNCPATWGMLGKGLAKGVFQLESPLGRQWTKKLKPETLEHMGALGAILRPGCLRAVDEKGVSMTMHYALRKNNVEEVTSYHPAIDAILFPTYNVLAYQEQAMAIAVAVAGFTEQEADMLRKAIGKKLPEEMAKCKTMFLEGAKKAGILSDEQIVEVFGWIEKSQRYSFNKSHSACYGVTGYHAAYIKAHHPLAFFTAWLRNAKNKQDPQQEVYELVNDARLFDIMVEPPDLRSMEAGYHTDRQIVRAGLGNIKGVGDAQIQKLRVQVTEAEGRIGKPVAQWDWYEFLVGCSGNVTSSVVMRLIQVGALRWFNKPRSDMEAEFKAWDALTDKERAWILEKGWDAYGRSVVEALKGLSNPKKEKPPTIRAPKKGREQEVAALEAEHADLVRERDALTPQDPEDTDSVDEAAIAGVAQRIQANRKAFTAATRPVPDPTYVPYEGPEGGCNTAARRQIVLSHVDLLVNPKFVRADTPIYLASLEEELLGISLTCNRVDSCDMSQVNCTCKEFIAGRTGFMMLGVEIGDDIRVLKTKSGKTPGAKYARMSLTDGTCSVEAVCWPDTWAEFRGVMHKGNMIVVQAERDFKDPDSSLLIVRKAWQAERA